MCSKCQPDEAETAERPDYKQYKWHKVTPDLDWGFVPGRVIVLLDGETYHSDASWRRMYAGECRFTNKGWNQDDLASLMIAGDMDRATVTHFIPFILPQFPDEDRDRFAALES